MLAHHWWGFPSLQSELLIDCNHPAIFFKLLTILIDQNMKIVYFLFHSSNRYDSTNNSFNRLSVILSCSIRAPFLFTEFYQFFLLHCCCSFFVWHVYVSFSFSFCSWTFTIKYTGPDFNSNYHLAYLESGFVLCRFSLNGACVGNVHTLKSIYTLCQQWCTAISIYLITANSMS